MASRRGLLRGDASEEELERQQQEFLSGRRPAAATVVRLNNEGAAPSAGEANDGMVLPSAPSPWHIPPLPAASSGVSGGESGVEARVTRGRAQGSDKEAQQRQKQQERAQLQKRKQQRQQQQQRGEQQSRSAEVGGAQEEWGERKSEYRPLPVLGGIREKGFADSPARPSAPLGPMSSLAFPVARHRAHGPHWEPAAVHAPPAVPSPDPSALPPPTAAAAMPVRRQQAELGKRGAEKVTGGAGSEEGKYMGEEGREGTRGGGEGGVGVMEAEGMVVDGGMAEMVGQASVKRVGKRERAAREGRIALAAAAADSGARAGAGGKAGAATAGGGGGRGVGVSDEQREIDSANREMVGRMSAAEVAEAQAELLARLPAGAVAMLRRRGREKDARRRGVEGGQEAVERGEGGGLVGVGGAASNDGGGNEQQAMQVDGGGESAAEQQLQSQHASTSSPPLPHQCDLPATWEQRVERIRGVRFRVDGRPVPADVAREAEAAMGVPAEAAMQFDKDTPQGMAVRELAVRQVAERDWLRTGAEPGRAGYTVREAVALSRSQVPSQAAAGLSVLSALLSRAAKREGGGIGRSSVPAGGDDGGSGEAEGRDVGEEVEGEEDWLAVWAYALSHEVQLLLAVRLALDHEHVQVLSAALTLTLHLLSFAPNHRFFALSQAVWRGESSMATAPVHKPKAASSFLPAPLSSASPSTDPSDVSSLLHAFASCHRWCRNVPRSELLLPPAAAGEEEEEEEEEGGGEGGGLEGLGLGGAGAEGGGERTVGSDANVACRDVCAGLIRMGILPRLTYLLQPQSPLQHHPHLHLPCLRIALCIAHHSPAAASALALSLHLLPPPPSLPTRPASPAPRSPLAAILAAPSSPAMLAAAADVLKACSAANPTVARHVASSDLVHLAFHHLLLLPLPSPSSYPSHSLRAPLSTHSLAPTTLPSTPVSALPPASAPAVLAVLSLWRVLARYSLAAHLFPDYFPFFATFLEPPFTTTTPAPSHPLPALSGPLAVWGPSAVEEGECQGMGGQGESLGVGTAQGDGVWGGAEVAVAREAVLVVEALCCGLPRLRGVVGGSGGEMEVEEETGGSMGWSVAVALLPMLLRWLQPVLIARLPAGLRATLAVKSTGERRAMSSAGGNMLSGESGAAGAMEVEGACVAERGGLDDDAGMNGVGEEVAAVAAVLHCLATIVTRAIPTTPPPAAAAGGQPTGESAGEAEGVAPSHVRPPFIHTITTALLHSGLLPCPSSSSETMSASLPPASPTFELLAAAAAVANGVGVASASCLHGVLRLTACLLLYNRACPPTTTDTPPSAAASASASPAAGTPLALSSPASAAASLSACVPAFLPLLSSSSRLLATRAAGSPLAPSSHPSPSHTPAARAGASALLWREGGAERGGPAPGVGAGWGGRGGQGGGGWWGMEAALSSQHIALVASLLALLQSLGGMVQSAGVGVSGRELAEVCFAVAGSAGPADSQALRFVLLHVLLSPRLLTPPLAPVQAPSTGGQGQGSEQEEGGEGSEEKEGSSGWCEWQWSVRDLLDAVWFQSCNPLSARTTAPMGARGARRGAGRDEKEGRLAAVEEGEEEGEGRGVEEEVKMEGEGKVQQEGGEKRVRFMEAGGTGGASGGGSGGGSGASGTGMGQCGVDGSSSAGAWGGTEEQEGSGAWAYLLQGACVAAKPLQLQWAAQTLPLPPAWPLIPLPAAAAVAAAAGAAGSSATTAPSSTAPSSTSPSPPPSSLRILHSYLAFLTALQTSPYTAMHMALLPASLKLHHLSLLFLADPPLYLHASLFHPIARLQDTFTQQLATTASTRDSHASTSDASAASAVVSTAAVRSPAQACVHDFPPHLFPPSAYDAFLQSLSDRFASASFGHVLFARQLATLLHSHVSPAIRLAAWQALHTASALHLLPPLSLCAANPMGYLLASPPCHCSAARDAGGAAGGLKGQGAGSADGGLLEACLQSVESGALDKCSTLVSAGIFSVPSLHGFGEAERTGGLTPHGNVPHDPLALSLAASLLVTFLFAHAPSPSPPTLESVTVSPHCSPSGPPPLSMTLVQSEAAMWQRQSISRRLARHAQRSPAARQLVARMLTWQMPGWRDGKEVQDGGADGKGMVPGEEGGEEGVEREEQGVVASGWVAGEGVVQRRMALVRRALQGGSGGAAETSTGAVAAGVEGDAALSALQSEAVRISLQSLAASI